MSVDDHNNDESFRDAISTVDQSGKRVWVYPKKPKGRYHRARVIVSVFLLTCLFSGPFIRIGGEPLLLINILERKFVIFGNTFLPHDFHLFAIAMLTMVVFIIVFTVVFGRLFCGWVCPQTIFMEMFFRKIEYWIEGDWKHQKALNKGPWTTQKIVKKVSKHSIFFFMSFLIANVFLAYVVGSEELIEIITDKPSEHKAGLLSILIFSGLFYGVFSWFREQVCTVVCPYGRLQGVLLDKKSIIVAYDYIRGEKRAKARKNEDRKAVGKGDCIDCHQCVDVCPTGIDIRNGTQLECVNCTACIDACDFMMDKVGLEKGLIRYASEENIESKKKKIKLLNPRIIAYSVVLLILFATMVSMLALRSEIKVTIRKTRGTIYEQYSEGKFSNIYNMDVANYTEEELPLKVEIQGIEGEVRIIGDNLNVGVGKKETGVFLLIVNQEEIEKLKTPIWIKLKSGEKEIISVKSTFIGPPK